MNITKNALVVILSFVLLVSLTVNVMASEDVNPEDRYNKYSCLLVIGILFVWCDV